MMVIFVSQCEKNALKKTRRVLDAFADRIGDNSWQTLITEEGLLTVKKMLRKTASKNTAVSCHWIRSRARSELLWVVGKRDAFNDIGGVPTNRTLKKLNHNEESDWQYLGLIQSLTAISALFHDWGKATALFQQKLKPNIKNGFKGDPIRHEWISCLLLSAYINEKPSEESETWLTRLSSGEINEDYLLKALSDVKSQMLINPFENLPPLAKLVAWLIVSHHRLPNLKNHQRSGGLDKYDANFYKGEKVDSIDQLLKMVSKEWGYENRYDEAEYKQRINACFSFPNGFLSQSKKWLSELKKWSKKLSLQSDKANQCLNDGSYRVVLHHARLSLMLGDHYYSSQDAAKQWFDTTGLFANTDRTTNKLKQKLDEHLVGVAKQGVQNAYNLPNFETQLPVANDVRSLKKASPKGYRWQDIAVEKITAWRQSHSHQKYGFFAVNMASTGCGKTFANAKVMRSLSIDSNSLRFTLALGLRTLTLQTGDEYRERIGLGDDELAVLIGSSAVLELHNQQKQKEWELHNEYSGSESQESLLNEEIDFDCDIPEKGLATVLTNQRDRKFLYAPVLSCTIDHIMAATETVRGGRYILPSLRMMSADLVIDEIDDFSGDDLIAIGRLIFFAGMMGRKVMISSATIPPDLAEGYFKAYRDGWHIYADSRNASKLIGCAWIDEFQTQVVSNNALEIKEAIPQYRNDHSAFVDNRVTKLKQQMAKRKAIIIPTQCIIDDFKALPSNDEQTHQTKQLAYFNLMTQAAIRLHQGHHTVDDKTKLEVSFGVIRVANIPPCVRLTEYLLNDFQCPPDTEIRVMAYHSQQVLLMRAEQEQHLDSVLKRKEKAGEMPKAFSQPLIRQHLDKIRRIESIKKVLFILVATPVEEVGRDHDFDWAVIEPSSYRSIIQLAGRVRRHREGETKLPNISVMQYNWKGIKLSHLPDRPAYEKPGFETKGLNLHSHDLTQLVDEKSLSKKLDAIPRIQKLPSQNFTYFRSLKSAATLAELEHASIWKLLANYVSKQSATVKAGDLQQGPNVFQGYLRESWWLTGLPQYFCHFRQSNDSLRVYLVYSPEKETVEFHEKNKEGIFVPRQLPLGITIQPLTEKALQRLWLTRDYQTSIEKMSEQQKRSMHAISMRYGELSFRHDEKQRYIYNDQLGLVVQ